MEINNLMGTAEAILFASGEPIQTSKIADALSINESVTYKLLKTIQDRYDVDGFGIMLVEMGDSFQFCTKPEYANVVKATLEMKRNTPLSNAAMEILAIIAYNQPVTKSFIEQIRGVDSSQTVNSLVEKGLVEEAGRLELPGRPIAYQITVGFLRNFGILSLDGLPPLPDESGQVVFREIAENEENQDNGK